MSDLLVARRYAGALYQVCLEQGVLNIVEKDLIIFSGVIKLNEDLYRLLLSPRISSRKKKNILERLFKDRLSQVTLNFICLMVDKKRESLFDEIAEIFSQIILENASIVIARVKVAFPLSFSEQEELIATFSRKTGKHVRLEIEEDPSIIGGIIVKIEDKVYDGSITGQLKAIEKKMAGTL